MAISLLQLEVHQPAHQFSASYLPSLLSMLVPAPLIAVLGHLRAFPSYQTVPCASTFSCRSRVKIKIITVLALLFPPPSYICSSLPVPPGEPSYLLLFPQLPGVGVNGFLGLVPDLFALTSWCLACSKQIFLEFMNFPTVHLSKASVDSFLCTEQSPG